MHGILSTLIFYTYNFFYRKRSHLEVENLEVKISLEELALTKLKCGDVAVILESYFTLINKIQV
jgi:hypothetical protein